MIIRPLTAGDGPALLYLLRHLDDESRFLRFHGIRRDLHAEAERLSRVDHWHHEALVALSPAPRTPIGVAEYMRTDAFDVAEIALAVSDQWQRQGVGSALVEALRQRALAAGIRQASASVIPGNTGALALVRNLGGPPGVRVVQRGVIDLLVDLTPPLCSANGPRRAGFVPGAESRHTGVHRRRREDREGGACAGRRGCGHLRRDRDR